MKKTIGERIFAGFNYFFLVLIGLITLLPFYVTFINSISPSIDFGTKVINLWPSKIELSAYKALIGQGSGLVNAYSINIYVTVVGTVLNIIFTLLPAIALANKKLPYRTGLTLFLVGTMYFGGGMIPAYLLIKYLGLFDNLWVCILPGLISTGYILYLRNFISTIPGEILESATIDGCSDIGLVWRIIVPLSGAAIATFALFYAVGHWNDYFSGAMFLTSKNKQPLQVYLREILRESGAKGNLNPDEYKKLVEQNLVPLEESLKAANIMAATIPIVCVYPFLQKYFVKGLVMGSLKG